MQTGATTETVKLIKITGMVLYIPIVLATGPFGGYMAGQYLQKKFTLGAWVLYLCIALGFAAAVTETVRALRMVARFDRKG
ncbi:MAG: AtpZ/AtpI family protein [Candidatus Omnitrophota bacterium]